MDDAKWAVVCNNGNGEALSVVLFDEFISATKFMNDEATETQDEYKDNVEYPDSIRIETYGEQAILFYGDDVELIWNIMPVEVY